MSAVLRSLLFAMLAVAHGQNLRGNSTDASLASAMEKVALAQQADAEAQAAISRAVEAAQAADAALLAAGTLGAAPANASLAMPGMKAGAEDVVVVYHPAPYHPVYHPVYPVYHPVYHPIANPYYNPIAHPYAPRLPVR